MSAVYPFVLDLVARRVQPDADVLEVGCGARQYERHLNGRYLGLDVPESRYVKEPPDIVASAESIPLNDASMDVIFGVAVFYYVPDIDAAFRECHRVLRKNGILLVFDYTGATIDRLRREGDRQVRHVWDRNEIPQRLVGAGFRRSKICDLSHRAADAGDPSLIRRAVRKLRRMVNPNYGQWLIVEARK